MPPRGTAQVQKQVEESQKQTKKSLDEVQSRFGEVITRLNALEKRADALEKENATMKDEIEQMKAKQPFPSPAPSHGPTEPSPDAPSRTEFPGVPLTQDSPAPGTAQ